MTICDRLQVLVTVCLVFTVTFFVYGSSKAGGVFFTEITSTVKGIDGVTHGLIFSLPMAMTQLTGRALTSEQLCGQWRYGESRRCWVGVFQSISNVIRFKLQFVVLL